MTTSMSRRVIISITLTTIIIIVGKCSNARYSHPSNQGSFCPLLGPANKSEWRVSRSVNGKRAGWACMMCEVGDEGG